MEAVWTVQLNGPGERLGVGTNDFIQSRLDLPPANVYILSYISRSLSFLSFAAIAVGSVGNEWKENEKEECRNRTAEKYKKPKREKGKPSIN